MPNGRDTRFDSNRKVTKEALRRDARNATTEADLEGEWAIDEDASNTIRQADEASRKTPTQTRYLHDKDY